MTHDPLFDLREGDLPICWRCGTEITGEVWARQEECPGIPPQQRNGRVETPAAQGG